MSAITQQTKHSVACRCGLFKASVSIDKGSKTTRVKCYCVDCQAYAWHLNPEEAQLDTNGGTDILQISPAQFSITQGTEYLGNLMLSPKGIYRWHTSCCQTPICNTPTKPSMPYVGLIANSILDETLAGKNHLTYLNKNFGLVKFGICAGANHPINADWPVSKGIGFRGMLGTLKNIAKWRLRGDHKRSVLIDSVSGKPLVEPMLLPLDQRKTATNKV